MEVLNKMYFSGKPNYFEGNFHCVHEKRLFSYSSNSPFVFQSCIIAIVVPDVDTLKRWAHENNIPGTLTTLCNDSRVKSFILNDMLNYGKESGLKSFEQVIITSNHYMNLVVLDLNSVAVACCTFLFIQKIIYFIILYRLKIFIYTRTHFPCRMDC